MDSNTALSDHPRRSGAGKLVLLRKRTEDGAYRPCLSHFRGISRRFFGEEAVWDFWSEMLLFLLIGAVSAWPLLQMIKALARAVR